MALTSNMLSVIEALTENRIQDAKQNALRACYEDTSKKNQYAVGVYTKRLLNENNNLDNIPQRIKHLVHSEDIENYKENRIYLNTPRNALLTKIKNLDNIYPRLQELDIKTSNTTLINGIAGTGKTEFCKIVAKELNLPFVYLNFSTVIDSLMGSTSKNIYTIFDALKGFRCVLCLDEIDCISTRRGNNSNSGSDAEINRITISLMQAFDNLIAGQIIIATTNRIDIVDEALLRRFNYIEEFTPYDETDRIKMIIQYIDDLEFEYDIDNIKDFAKKENIQSDIIRHINNKIIDTLLIDENAKKLII